MCQELNIFLQSAGKPQKSLTACYGTSDERGGQLGTEQEFTQERRNSCYLQRNSNKGCSERTLNGVHWGW